MRTTLFAFAIIALSLHLYARQTALTPEQVYAGHRVTALAGTPIPIR